MLQQSLWSSTIVIVKTSPYPLHRHGGEQVMTEISFFGGWTFPDNDTNRHGSTLYGASNEFISIMERFKLKQKHFGLQWVIVGALGECWWPPVWRHAEWCASLLLLRRSLLFYMKYLWCDDPAIYRALQAHTQRAWWEMNTTFPCLVCKVCTIF